MPPHFRRFEVFTAVNVWIVVFWLVTLSRLAVFRMLWYSRASQLVLCATDRLCFMADHADAGIVYRNENAVFMQRASE
jgi:hypothetical protein